MEKNYIGLLLLSTLTGLSCNNTSEKCGACPLAAIDMTMKVRLVDKTTGVDLLPPNSPYKASDLKVSKSLNDPNFYAVTDTINHIVRLYDGQDITYTLQLANLSADQIKIVTAMTDQKCCATRYVKSIMLNDSVVCSTNCNPQMELVIKK